MNKATERIREQTAKTHRCEGKFGKVRWQVTLASRQNRNDPVSDVFAGVACRFNDKTETLGFWATEKDLNLYEQRLQTNRTWIDQETLRLNRQRDLSLINASEQSKKDILQYYDKQAEQLGLRAPFAPIQLAHSALYAMDFNLSEIESAIDRKKNELLQQLGILPRTSIVFPLNDNESGVQAVLKVWF